MSVLDKITQFCETVQGEIRWKKAHPKIMREIETHLHEQKESYQRNGNSLEESTEKAILQMGDPVEMGRSLDETHRPKAQVGLLVASSLILCLTAVVRSLFLAQEITSSVPPTIPLHTLPVAISLLFAGYFMDFSLLGRKPLLSMAAIYGFGVFQKNTSHIGYSGALSIDYYGGELTPSYVGFLFAFCFSLLIYSMRGKQAGGLILTYMALFPLSAVLLRIPSATAWIQFLVVSVLVFVYAQFRNWFGLKKTSYCVALLAQGVLGIFVCQRILNFFRAMEYRIGIFVTPENDPYFLGVTYQHIRDVFSNLTLFGSSVSPTDPDITFLFMEHMAYNYPLLYLSQAYGGIVLLTSVVLGSLFLTYLLVKSLKEKSILGCLLSVTISLCFMVQGICQLLDNIGYNVMLGSSEQNMVFNVPMLWLNSLFVGILLSIFRTGEVYEDKVQKESLKKLVSKLPLTTFLKHSPIHFHQKEGSLTISIKRKGSVS